MRLTSEGYLTWGSSGNTGDDTINNSVGTSQFASPLGIPGSKRDNAERRDDAVHASVGNKQYRACKLISQKDPTSGIEIASLGKAISQALFLSFTNISWPYSTSACLFFCSFPKNSEKWTSSGEEISRLDFTSLPTWCSNLFSNLETVSRVVYKNFTNDRFSDVVFFTVFYVFFLRLHARWNCASFEIKM